MRERAFAVEWGKMHDTRAGLQRAEEVHRMVRRIAEEQRHRMVAAVAGAQERRGRNLDHRFQLGIADRAVAKFDRRPRAVFGRGFRQQIRQRPARDRIVPMDPFRIELFAGLGHGCSASSFRGAPTGPRKARPDDRLRASPESITTAVSMDSGPAPSGASTMCNCTSGNDGVSERVALLGRSNSKHTFTTSPRHAPEPLLNLPPKEGVGNAGCPLHPRPRVHFLLVERTRVNEYTGITRHSRTQWF